MPGLGGFAGKIYLMVSMADAGGAAAYALIAVLLFNTLLSLYYYLRPVYFMVFVADAQDRPGFVPPAGWGSGFSHLYADGVVDGPDAIDRGGSDP